MPDQYGRTTGEDLLKLGIGISNWAKSQREDADRQQVALGINALESGQPRPGNVTPYNWTTAEDQYGKAQVSMQAADKAGREKREDWLSNKWMEQVNQARTPEERLQVLKSINPGDLSGAQALARVQKQGLANNELYSALVKSMAQQSMDADKTVIQPAMFAADKLLKDGRDKEAAQTISDASKIVPIRGEWRPEQGDDGQVLMRRYHNLRESGFVDEGEGKTAPPDGMYPTDEAYPIRDFMGKLKDLGFQGRAKNLAAQMQTNMEFNGDAFFKHVYNAVGPNGEKRVIVPQINLRSGMRENFVYDGQNGKLLDRLDNDQLQTSGLRVVTKEQRAQDTEDRKVSAELRRADTDARRLGLQERALDIREDNSGGNASAAADFVKLKNQKLALYAKDGETDPSEAEAKATEAALADFRLLPGFEDVKTPADVAARSRAPKGVKKGVASQTPGLGVGQPQAPAQDQKTSAQAIWDGMKGKK
jgi:hypothetical protein